MSTDSMKIEQLKRELKINLNEYELNILKDDCQLKGYSLDNNYNIIGLNLVDCRISDISFLKELLNLKWLNLYLNQISDISPLKDLSSLEWLNLSDNQISDISILKDLPRLKKLDLSGNQISDLSTLKNLSNLESLTLRRNEITDITILKYLTNLKKLDLRENQLKYLPIEIIELNLDIRWESDHGIILADNPIDNKLIKYIGKGREGIIEYFKLSEGEKQDINEVRIFLLGNLGAGKTSLVKQLLKNKIKESESQIYDINIISGETKVRDKNIKIHFWDFGSQVIKHSTFQFFLSKHSLYILVLDSSSEENVEYWLKIIEKFGGESPIFIVLNKIDENHGFEVDRKSLQNKYKNIKGFYRVSCKNRQGVDEFADIMIEELVSNNYLNMTWAKNWFNVKKKLKEKTSSYNYIYPIFRKHICKYLILIKLKVIFLWTTIY